MTDACEQSGGAGDRATAGRARDTDLTLTMGAVGVELAPSLCGCGKFHIPKTSGW